MSNGTRTPIRLSYTPDGVHGTGSYFDTWFKGNPTWVGGTAGTMLSGAWVPWQKGEFTIVVRFTQTAQGTSSALKILTSIGATYMGKVNSTTWTLTNGSPRTWQFEGLHATSRDAGVTFEAAVTLHYRPETFDRLVAFNDPATGLPPTDLVSGTGYKYVRIQDEVDFNTIPFPTLPGFA